MEKERGGEKVDIKRQHKYLKHLVLDRNACLMVQVVVRCAIETTCVVLVCIALTVNITPVKFFVVLNFHGFVQSAKSF